MTQQRDLYRRWTSEADVHPHERLVGLLALLHAASSLEARTLKVSDINIHDEQRAVSLGSRPQPTPLDPATWAALQATLSHRQALGTLNPHVLVTRGTKADARHASTHTCPTSSRPPASIPGYCAARDWSTSSTSWTTSSSPPHSAYTPKVSSATSPTPSTTAGSTVRRETPSPVQELIAPAP